VHGVHFEITAVDQISVGVYFVSEGQITQPPTVTLCKDAIKRNTRETDVWYL
jgi:hypothetical protein